MIYGLYHSAAGMMTQEYRQNVIANNLANADTVGFKPEIAVFSERVPAAEAGVRDSASADWLSSLSGGVWLGQTQTDFGQGALQQTENDRDVALDGPGFFAVEDNGKILYTRDGRMLMDADGVLRAAADGALMLGVGGTQIQMNPHGRQPTFDEDGRVLQDGVVVGQLAISDFADPYALRHVGDGRFNAGEQETIESPARVLSGHLERSKVAPVEELVSMMETQRAFQMNARMIGMQDESLGRLISTIGR